MTTNNLLVDDGPRWHLFIRQGVSEIKMLDQAARYVQEGRSGVVHYHASNHECVSKCEFVEPEGSGEE